jgi:hypothetical protein
MEFFFFELLMASAFRRNIFEFKFFPRATMSSATDAENESNRAAKLAEWKAKKAAESKFAAPAPKPKVILCFSLAPIIVPVAI